MAEAPAPAPAQGEQEKPKRGKPKDPLAPPRPKSGYTKFGGECRERLKRERPELITDLSGMGKAIAEEWLKVPQAEKDKMQVEYEAEMKIWKPKWAAYKETEHYKKFFEIKQDWIDARQRKKLPKKMIPDAPKRPKSGYMILAGEIRESVMNECKEKGLGLGDAGKIIADRWAALSEAKKAEYAERSAEQKRVFDIEYVKFKATDTFKTYMDAKSKLEASQTLKKTIRTHMDEAPKKAPSAYALYRAEVMPGIVEENEKKPAGEKLAVGDIGKKVAQLWVDVPEDKKAPYVKRSEAAKAEYEKKMQDFKKSMKYTQFLEKRQSIKARENTQLNLREMPRRPKSVFAMFCEENKDKVPAGKGEGKGRSALKALFIDLPEEKKKEYANKEAELKEEWMKAVKEYKDGTKYQNFLKVKDKIKKEFENEAVKTTTMRFLADAPSPPPKTPFAVFLHEKRKRDGKDANEKLSKAQKVEQVKEAKTEFMKLDKTVKGEYEVKRKEEVMTYEARIKEFMESDRWKDYVKEAKRLRIPVKSLLYHKKKIVKKLANGKISPMSIALPAKPDLFPDKPQNAMQMFVAAKKKEGVAIVECSRLWQELGEDDKKTWLDKGKAAMEEFDKEMREFKNSEEGKMYFRNLKSAKRRRTLLAAKNKFLDELPKKPSAAVVMWMKEEAPKLKKQNRELKGFEIKKQLTDRWNAMSPEEKQPINEAAAQRMKEFTEKLDAFKKGENWQNFVKATRIKKMVKKVKKGVKKAPSGPRKPASMPVRPLGAYQSFAKENAGIDQKTILEKWKALSEEDMNARKEQAAAAEKKFQEDTDMWNKSVEGRKYISTCAKFKKAKTLADAKNRYLKDQPKKPMAAYFLFINERRPTIVADNPDLKGMAAIQSKIAQVWKDLSAEERAVYEDKEKESKEKYEEANRAFQATAEYKKYAAVERRVNGVKVKKGKVKNKAPPQPAKPENLPKKPSTAMTLFFADRKKEGGGGGLREQAEAWTKLGADGQKPYVEKAREQANEYEVQMKQFQRTAEGKKYLREMAQWEKRAKLNKAKERFLGGSEVKEPKKPPSPYFLFVQEKRGTVKGGLAEVAKQMTEMWKASDQAPYNEKAEKLKAQYDEDLAAWKNSKGYKMYARAVDNISGKRARMAKQRARIKQMAAAKKKAAASRGKGARGAAGGAARAAPAAAAADSDSDSDVMGSDSDSSSSSKDSDSD